MQGKWLRKSLWLLLTVGLTAGIIFLPFLHRSGIGRATHDAGEKEGVPDHVLHAGVKERQTTAGSVYYRDGVIVLMYHNINPRATGRGTITPEHFKSELDLLKEKGFQFISASQLAAFLDRRGSIPPNAVLVSFDDGYEGTYRYALPVLEEEHVPAVLFITEGFMGTRRGMLTWPEVRSLERSGLVAIGGHTCEQHYRIPGEGGTHLIPATVTRVTSPKTGKRESVAEYEERMLADSRRAQRLLYSELGHTTPYFAYPYGAYTPQLVRILHSAGYRYMFTVIRGFNTREQDPAHIYRINAGAPWISPERLFVTIRYTVLKAKLLHRTPDTWIPT